MLFRRSAALRAGRSRPQAVASQAAVSAVAGLALLVTGNASAWSQETIYVGGGGQRGSVQVDMSVLDELGAPRSTPGGGRIVLRPPSEQSQPRATTPRSATAAKPAPSRPAAATTRTANAKPPTRRADAPPARAETPPPPPPEPVESAAPPPSATASATGSPPADIASPISEPEAAPSETAVNRPAAPAVPMAAPSAASAAMAAPETPGAAASITRTAETIAPVQAPPTAAAPAPPPPTIAPSIPESEKVPAPPPTQTAALAPPAAAVTGGVGGPRDLRIPFSGEAAVLTDPAKGEIKQLAGTLAKDQALRVQVKAYAGGGDDASKARRLSLSRALAVRTYLIEQGIGSTRIDVRALGNNAEGGPSDRVDLIVVTR